MHQRFVLLATVGVVGLSAVTALALPIGGTYFPFNHRECLLFTTALRQSELEVMNAGPGDAAYDRSEFDDALAVLSKYGCTGVILPDEVIELRDRRRDLSPYGIEFFKRSELAKTIVSKPVGTQ